MPPCYLFRRSSSDLCAYSSRSSPASPSAGGSPSAPGGAQVLLAVLEAQAAAAEARLQQRLHALRALHQGVDLFQLARGEHAPARRGGRLLGEAREEDT